MRKIGKAIKASSLILLCCVGSCSAQPDSRSEVKTLFEKLADLSLSASQDIGADGLSQGLEDSIVNLNQQIVNTILANPVLLSDTDLLFLKRRLDVSLVRSKGDQANVYSWDIGMDPNEKIYNNVIVYRNKAGKLFASHYSGINQKIQFGENYSTDSVYSIDGNRVIILNQSGTCGSACVLKKLAHLKVVGERIVDTDNGFKNGDICLSDLRYRYRISNLVENEPDFHVDIQEKVVVMPKLSEDNSEVIGKVEYHIGRCD